MYISTAHWSSTITIHHEENEGIKSKELNVIVPIEGSGKLEYLTHVDAFRRWTRTNSKSDVLEKYQLVFLLNTINKCHVSGWSGGVPRDSLFGMIGKTKKSLVVSCWNIWPAPLHGRLSVVILSVTGFVLIYDVIITGLVATALLCKQCFKFKPLKKVISNLINFQISGIFLLYR